MSSLDGPPRAGRSVFHDDAAGGQLLADRVGTGKVSGCTSFGAFGEAVFDPGRELLVDGFVLLAMGESEESEHGIDAIESGQGGIRLGAGDGQRAELIEAAVGIGDEIVE